ncbi:MAG: hypothetical protein EBR82_83190 [Caulobacteraceae bacterium]|nr:hypothetical protein [Caulobacteraceae bacterium]
MANNPYQGDDVDSFQTARDEEGNVKQTGLSPTAKLSRFGAAFNAARKKGEKIFEFNGKKYTTELASEKPATTKKAPESRPMNLNASPNIQYKNAPKMVQLSDSEGYGLDEARGGMKRGGKVKKMASGGSASKRADGCCVKGKTRGKMM